uniref:UDP-glucuronosyltransferase n=1 Tax=Globodera rostochiensis TaxID=31243 RepID=A0A914HJM9_GLORO
MRNILFSTVLCLILASILETDATPSPNKPKSSHSTSQKETSSKNSNITAETAGTSSPGNDQPVIETFLDTSPKLRVLIMTYRTRVTESHYMFHRKLAELLVADTENVEKVLLLVSNNGSANETNEEPPEFDGRLLVWTRINHAMLKEEHSSVWDDITKMFLPNGNEVRSIQLEFLTKHPVLIQQLQEFKFNVGVMETSHFDHSLNLFRAFPTIKKYIGSQNTSPTIAQWKYLGYDKIVGAMPGKNLARIVEWDVKHRMDLYFTNIQPFLDFPIVEQEIEQKRKNTQQNRVNFIGGITMTKGKVPNLNPDTKQIFESAKDGVVLLSFGSAVEMDDGDERAVSVKNIVVDVFKQYPQMNLIIKWGKRPSSGTVYNKLSENVYAKSWLEQEAILGGGLKLFITHGGQNSINEAVKFSVPIILFPFFGDQYNNAEALAARGVSKVLDIRSKTLNNDLTEALHEIFNKYSEHKAGMDELSKKMNSVEPAKEFVEKFRQLRKSL